MTNDALLLDTHAWIWLVLEERDQMSTDTWDAIEQAATTHSIAVSEISFWEVAVKATKGKLLTRDPRDWLHTAASKSGVGVVQVDRHTLIHSALLAFDHRDPADRILIATAMEYQLRLVTADEAILGYARQSRDLAVLDARP
jgi:PIN domain nuclease of toxin-antitoxin system